MSAWHTVAFKSISLKLHYQQLPKLELFLTLLHSERPKLYTILVFLGTIGISWFSGMEHILKLMILSAKSAFPAVVVVMHRSYNFALVTR